MRLNLKSRGSQPIGTHVPPNQNCTPLRTPKVSYLFFLIFVHLLLGSHEPLNYAHPRLKTTVIEDGFGLKRKKDLQGFRKIPDNRLWHV
jgi:hypothetical protein